MPVLLPWSGVTWSPPLLTLKALFLSPISPLNSLTVFFLLPLCAFASTLNPSLLPDLTE